MFARKSDRDLKQFGLIDQDEDDELLDEDLQKELDMLLGLGKPSKKSDSKIVSPAELDSMVNACLEDVPEDIEVDLEGEDADLMEELSNMMGDSSPQLPKKRIERPDSPPEAPVRPQVTREPPFRPEVTREPPIRPEVTREPPVRPEVTREPPVRPKEEHPVEPVATHKEPLVEPASKLEEPVRPTPTSTVSVDPSILQDLQEKREKYKQEALKAKAEGDKPKALEGLKAVKAIDVMIQRYKDGEPLELKETTPPDPTFYGAPSSPPTSILEALTQRLEKYRGDQAKAKESGNDSKVRRLNRICKQYEDAIKAHKAGKSVPFDDLPTPPGFAPIPTNEVPPPQQQRQPQPTPPPPPPPPQQQQQPQQRKKVVSTTADKQLNTLLKRQSLFKTAALEAKRSGQLEQAKEYLRQYKGFDKLIDASKGGLPIDMNTLPIPPQLTQSNCSMDFEIVSREDCSSSSSSSSSNNRQEMFSKLEQDLIKQIEMCKTNRKYFKLTGDIASSNKFHQMEEHSKKDLDALRHSYTRGDAIPKFHYEIRSFSRIQCNTDLTDNDCEVTIVAGTNYKKRADTYVRYEFPYPKEDPYKDKTAVIRDSNNPSYEHTALIPININEKTCQRIFKRHSVKCEVYAKGGFLRSDVLVGVASAKLQKLESQCTLHESFPLMDGRKAVGGQLEIKVRLRNPVLTKQLEKVQEKWLVISFI